MLVVGESEPQRALLFRDADRGGIGFDMLWSEDFHHTATVAATGNREGYYGDYIGSPQELISVLKRGWLYQGQWDLRQSKRRGSPGSTSCRRHSLAIFRTTIRSRILPEASECTCGQRLAGSAP